MSIESIFFDAVSKGDLSEVNSLLAENSRLITARNENGVSAILFALYQQKKDIAELLLAEKPTLDIFEAAATGQIERLTSLLESDHSLANAEAPDGACPLHLACFFSQTEAVKILLKSGSQTEIAVAAFGGVYPIHSAAASGSVDIVQILLEAGADPNTKQQAGWTALHSAVMHNNIKMTKALLTHGADRSIKSDDAKTAKDLCSTDSPQELLELLNEQTAI